MPVNGGAGFDPRQAIEVNPKQVLFRVLFTADGVLEWESVRTGDPQTDEILLRGYFDKIREAVLDAAKRGSSPLRRVPSS